MKTAVALLLVGVSMPFDCGEDKELFGGSVPVLSVTLRDTVNIGEPIVFETTCGIPNPCWEFQRFEISQRGFQYYVKVFAEYDGRPCIQVLSSFKAGTSVLPTERGKYVFSFWQSEDQTLDTTTVVK